MNNTEKQNCPTCGSEVLKHSGDEGTGFFTPIEPSQEKKEETAFLRAIRNEILYNARKWWRSLTDDQIIEVYQKRKQ